MRFWWRLWDNLTCVYSRLFCDIYKTTHTDTHTQIYTHFIHTYTHIYNIHSERYKDPITKSEMLVMRAVKCPGDGGLLFVVSPAIGKRNNVHSWLLVLGVDHPRKRWKKVRPVPHSIQ